MLNVIQIQLYDYDLSRRNIKSEFICEICVKYIDIIY
nr:MAG TPA: hypothetical protein [Caudoviricetes sp.]